MINYFDLFAAIVTIGLAVWGFREGIIRGVIKLAGFFLVLALLAVFSSYIVETALTIDQLPGKVTIPVFFVLAFALGTILFHYLAELGHKLTSFSPVKIIDSSLGCLFGMFKAALLNGLLALILSLTPPDSFPGKQYAESQTAKTFNTMLAAVIPFVKSTVEPLIDTYKALPDVPDEQKNEQTAPRQII